MTEAEAYASGMMGLGPYSESWHHGDKVMYNTIARAVKHGIDRILSNPQAYGIGYYSREQAERFAEWLDDLGYYQDGEKGKWYSCFDSKKETTYSTTELFSEWATTPQGKELLGQQGEDWIRVEDGLPEKTGYYLVYEMNCDKPGIEVYRFDSYNQSWYWGADCFHPTHWKKLPNAPKQHT